MVTPLDDRVDVSVRAATILLLLFLIAVLSALAITLDSVAAPVGIVAILVVGPIVILTIFLLYFERRQQPWSFAGAAGLGFLGVTLRVIVNARPQLEVGGGLPLWVTAAYVALGTLVAATSLWAFISLRRATRPGSRDTPPA